MNGKTHGKWCLVALIGGSEENGSQNVKRFFFLEREREGRERVRLENDAKIEI